MTFDWVVLDCADVQAGKDEAETFTHVSSPSRPAAGQLRKTFVLRTRRTSSETQDSHLGARSVPRAIAPATTQDQGPGFQPCSFAFTKGILFGSFSSAYLYDMLKLSGLSCLTLCYGMRSGAEGHIKLVATSNVIK